MANLQWDILTALASSKKPMRAGSIARAVRKSQSHVEYHLEQMVAEGRILVSVENDAKLYSAQKLLTSNKARNDLLEVFLASMPDVMPFLDLTQAADPTKAYISSIHDLLCITAQRLKKQMDGYKQF